MNLTARQPSTDWEIVDVPDVPDCRVWAWFKPPQVPTGVVLQIPGEIHQEYAGLLTVRRLLEALSLPPTDVHSWTVLGVTYPVHGGANPLLDEPVPQPGPPGICIHTEAPAMVVPPPMVPAADVNLLAQTMPVVPGDPLSTLAAIDAEWQAILQLDRQLDSVRRQLSSVQGALQSLNRDLTPDEWMYSDSNDKKDWQDTRRWLRDALAHISKAIRAHDIGTTSAAGNRRRFEQIHQTHVIQRNPFPGMEAELHAFEQHRKTSQHLLQQMQLILSTASRDAIQRARHVLAQIGAKIRAGRARR